MHYCNGRGAAISPTTTKSSFSESLSKLSRKAHLFFATDSHMIDVLPENLSETFRKLQKMTYRDYLEDAWKSRDVRCSPRSKRRG